MAGEIRVDILDELQDQKTSGSQASTSHDDDQTERENIEIDENAEEVKDLTKHSLGELIQDDQKLLAELKREEAEAQSSQTRGTIHKVPKIMWENVDIQKYYMPRQIAIGPLHANDPKFSKRELKVKLARKFINSSGVEADILFNGIKNEIKGIKQYFDKDMIPNCYEDDSLARLLFLDGCAVLQFMCSYVSSRLKDFKIINFQVTSMKLDLFLLENQIPFEVLILLMENIKDEDWRKNVYSDLLKFVLGSNICVHSNNEYQLPPIDEFIITKPKPVHLLDLLRTVCIFGSIKEVENRVSKPKEKIQKRYFRNVQELKSSGIRMEPSGSHSLMSVSFYTNCFGIRGCLKLPALTMKASTMCKLLNLVAYEAGLDDDDQHRVTSYVTLMNLLIETEKDVKDLRVAKILVNPRLSDEEIARLFNMTNSVYLTKDQDCYQGIKKNLEDHYRKKYAIWIAEVLNKHFSNP